MKSMIKTIALLCAGVLGTVFPAAASIVYSEDFSSGSFGSSVVPGWTLTPEITVFDSSQYIIAGGFGDTGTGLFLSYNSGGASFTGIAASPLVNLNSGQQYTLSFDFGAFSKVPGSQSVRVLFDNVLLGTIEDTTATDDLTTLLTRVSLNFTAGGAGAFTFEDASTGSSLAIDFLVDNVQVETIGQPVDVVPEPGSFALMIVSLLSFLGIGLMRRSARI